MLPCVDYSLLQEVGHVAGEAADSVKHGAHNVAAGARHAASATGHAAHDAKEWTKEKAGVSCWGGAEFCGQSCTLGQLGLRAASNVD